MSVSFYPDPSSPYFRLTDEELRFFAVPRTWYEIKNQKPLRDENWWRDAVIDADEVGRGLLVWNKRTLTWKLSALGRARLGLGEEPS